MAQLPSSEEADDFVSKVDEVSRLVDGLSTGKISPQYIDSKINQEQGRLSPKASSLVHQVPHMSQTLSGGVGAQHWL